ncbi:MAG: HAD family hydrolase [Candidatus Melainabacteria bacterium]|nr:HAD family hydrolase [Candidatus Melainabacteria bacterium]
MYKLAIFDFDGTLVDSAPGIVDVMREIVAEYNVSQEVFGIWQQLIGVPLMKQMEIIFPNRDETYHQKVANRYRAIYDSRVIEICPPFPGLNAMLHQLQAAEVHITIASSKRRNLIEPVLEHHRISSYFRMLIGSQDVSNHKPHPESVHLITSKLEIPYQHVVVIGDSSYDLEMARNAGVDGIGVTTGIHTREMLAASEPLHIVNKLDDVAPLILNGRKLA